MIHPHLSWSIILSRLSPLLLLSSLLVLLLLQCTIPSSYLVTALSEEKHPTYSYTYTTYSPNEFSSTDTSSIYLNCPLLHAQIGDKLVFFEHRSPIHQVILDKSNLRASYAFALPEFNKTVAEYRCELQRSVENGMRIISKIQLLFTSNITYESFIYERHLTQLIEGTLGEPLTVICNSKTSSSNSNDANTLWYRPPKLQISGQTTPRLHFDKLTADDLGTYFCADQSTLLQRHLPVQKIEIWSNNYISDINVGNLIKGENDDHNYYYLCSSLPNDYTLVTWEHPIGHVIVNAFTEKLFLSSESHLLKGSTPICQYGWIDNTNETLDNQVFLKRVRRQTDVIPYITISRRIDPDDVTVTLQCHMPTVGTEGVSYNYQWSTETDGKIGDGDTIVHQIISDHIPVEGVKTDTSITCEVISPETEQVVGTVKLDMEPKPLGTTGKMELSESTTEIYSYRVGETLEIHCELEKDFGETGSDVTWRFNGGTLPIGTNRVDKLRTSIIVINELQSIHEGSYECEQKTRKQRGHILQAPTVVTINVEPKEDERWANAGDIAEFHCRLDGRDQGNQLTDWYFIPEGGDREIALPDDVKIERPDATPSTTFLSILNVQKYHEGEYVCRALNLKDSAKLRVKTRDLTVTPEEVKARPGTTVQFLCELSTVNGMKGGKVYWMRTDRQGLRPGKEEVIGTNGGRALLIVKDVGRFEHNITYMCTDGFSKGYAKLYVQEVCAPGYRPCGAQECIEETKFCDGVVDCADGSDEIPSKCSECGANELTCGMVDDVKPLKNCYLQFWHCDGEDDCGNNFDEANCLPPSDYDKCNGTHYTCPRGEKMIARAFMCDSVPDCEPDGDDENECSYPSIIEPSGETQLIGHQSGNLTLTCVAYGRPPPTISWRYNWGHLREGVTHSINYTVINCNMAVSHLTLTDLQPRASGLYTCEAVNRGRALAPDFLVNVAKGGICKAPQFNDAAWFEDMCLSCYCSNVTDKCESVKGYRKSPHDKAFNSKSGPIILSTYKEDGSVEEGQGVTEVEEDLLRIPDVPDESTFAESDFGLLGSWVTSYGYNIKLNIRLFGESSSHLRGPYLILHSSNRSLYWCPPTDRLLVHIIPTGYDNRVNIRLSERERWHIDKECKEPVDQTIGRAGFMQVLGDVKKVGLRVKYFRDQSSLELYNLRVEHAVKSDVPGQWVGEIEQCTCPYGYEGLSCEKCAPGYQKDPEDPLKCRPFCACDKCDADGNCINCPGNRAGPRCQQCKEGFYRPDKNLITTDCQPCDMCGNNLPYVVKKCHFNPQTDDDYFCKCKVNEDGKLIDAQCDRCKLAVDVGDEPPEDAKCDTKPEPSDCHYHGTQSITDSGECQCKTGYSGEKCNECTEGYFNHEGKCLQCYCSGKTSSCRLSDEHYFWNITPEDSAGFGFNVWLGQRLSMGGVERVERTPDGVQRIERVDDSFYVKHPLSNKGVIHFGIDLISPKPASPTQNDVTIYKYLYGGQMSFKIDSIKTDPKELTQREASVVVELESPRYGRLWTLAIFNLEKQRYEIEFNENWWPGGWRLGTPLNPFDSQASMTRDQLLRVLTTTTSIGIITSSGESESLNGMKLSGLSIQVALPVRTSERQSFARQQGLPLAPVEVCECPNPSGLDERELSPSCEGCKDLSKQTIIRLEPLGEDLTCGGCSGSQCGKCSEGEYNYDIYSGKSLDVCQKGLTIDTKSHQIIVKLGEPINLVCKATSYRGGLVTHEWITPQKEYASQPSITRKYLEKSDQYEKGNMTTYRTEALLEIKSAKPEDAGEYICVAKGVGSEMNETFYVIVRDPSTSPPEAPEDDEVNRKFPLPTPSILDTPEMAVYEIKQDPENPQITLISGQVKPDILETYHTVWQSVNGTPFDTKTEITDTARGVFTVRLPIPYESVNSGNETIIGYFVGKDPIYTPYWTRMTEPTIVDTEAGEISPDDIINPPAEVSIPFMQPYTIRVGTKPGKEDISVIWRKVGPLPETVVTEKKPAGEEEGKVEPKEIDISLPEGVTPGKTNLNIWAAAEQHEGVYEGTVVRDRDGVEVKRVQTIIRVKPMSQGGKTELGLAEAAETIEDDTDGDDVDEEGKELQTWDFIVSGFTPDAQHCEHPTWTVVDYQINKTVDITDKVDRTSDTHFKVNYPLTSGLYLRFQCQPIPKSNLTGEIRFNVSSPDPRIILKPFYDNPDSTFPTRLVCLDVNPEYDSSISLTSSSMSQEKISYATVPADKVIMIRKGDIPASRRLEIDWRRIGEFDPYNDAGYYTCFVNNTETNGSRTIKIPADKVPVLLPEDPFTRLYIYSPDTYVVPEADGTGAKVMIPEGERLRIYCVFEARPFEEFTGWHHTNPEIEDNLKIDHKSYSSLAKTEKAELILDGQKIECTLGQRSKVVEISVIPKDERRIHAKILSDAFVNDRLIGITGGDLNLTCDVKHVGRKPAAIDRIDWYVQYPNGIRREIKRTKLAESITTSPQGEWIYFDRLSVKPQGVNVFCVVRLEDIQKATQAYYSSPQVSLWLREPKLLVYIDGEDRPGIVSGAETQTLKIKCIVKDAWRNKTIDDAEIDWETKVTSIQEEMSDNNERARPQPSPRDYPMLGAKALYDQMIIAGIRRQPNWIARFRCKGTDLKTGASEYSDYVKLEVLAGDTLEQIPKLRIVSHTDPSSPYPNKVECIDDNQNHESQVTWTRQDESIDQEQITTAPNSAVLKWMYNGVDKFDPRIHAGIYTCRAVNPYSSSVKQVYIPYDLMPTDFETPITPEVRIFSNVNEIFQDAEDRYVRVIQGQPFELICTFYGHPPPEGGLQWSIDRFNGTRSSLSSHWLSMQGLIIHSGRHYWTQIGSPQFDAQGRHTGVFQCTALNSIGQIIERDQVRVELHKVYVRINELSESGLIENQKGQNGTITCNAYDGYLQFILPDATYTWEVERINGERVHPNLIADQVEIDNNQLRYYGLSSAANNLRIRCISLNDTARYISSDFSFRVYGEKGEPVKTSDVEPGGTRWISGDGEERITLRIGGKSDLTNHVTIKEGENVQLNCTAHDTVTGRLLTDGDLHFGWRLLGAYEETVPEASLARQSVESYITDNGNTGVFIVQDARPSPNLPQPTARIQCLATSYTEGVTYYSSLVDFIVYPDEIPIDHVKDVKDREKLNRLTVNVIGLDNRGKLSGTEGSSVNLECIAKDRSTKQPTKESVHYGWEFSRLDGTPVDTTALIGSGESKLEMRENSLTLQGLKQTTSIRGRCRVSIPPEEVTDETQVPSTEEVFYSPYFRFDVTDATGSGRRDFAPPAQPIITTKDSDIFVKVEGLDENGALTADKGEDVELKCVAINQTTNEPITEESSENLEVNYGLEVIRLSGLPAAYSELAQSISVQPDTGEFKLTGLRSQSDIKDIRRRIQGRCIAEIKQKSDDQPIKRYASQYFLVNVPKDIEALPDYVDVSRSRYEVTVGGLNEYGVLKVQPGQNIQLKCIIRDKETDTLMDSLTPNQFIGWQFPALPSGYQVNMGDFARRSKVEGNELHLEDIRSDFADNLQGRCWFDDGFMYYYSAFFPIISPKSTTDGRVRVEVSQIGTMDDRQYICTAYDSRTGQRLQNVIYDWKFTTPNGDVIPPVYYFNSLESQGNKLILGSVNTHRKLPEHLSHIQRIEGRCVVLAYEYVDDDMKKPGRMNTYQSRPFIVINPSAVDPNELLTSPDQFIADQRLYVTVDGLTNGGVIGPAGSTVTLTCNAYDSSNHLPVEGLKYYWEIKRRDGTPVDTAILARDYVNIIGPGGNTLILGNLRSLSSGVTGRCIVVNETTPDPGISDGGLLRSGERIFSQPFDFIITGEAPSSATDDVLYGGHKDYDIDGKDYEVVVVGLDEDGRLKVAKGDNKTFTVFLRHKETSEEIYPGPPNAYAGIETRYINGYPSSLSMLADAIEFQSDSGKFNLYNMKEPSTSPPVQMRFVIERKEFDEDGKPKDIIRYASQYIDLLPAEGDEIAGGRLAEPVEKIYPIIDGLNSCGRLPLVVGNNVTLICRPNDTRLLSESLIYDWEIRDLYGQILPRTNLLAKSIKQENNRLILIDMIEPNIRSFGRCIIMRTSGVQDKYGSEFFEFGEHGEGCEPSEAQVVTDIPGYVPKPDERYDILIQIQGLNKMGEVVAKPGDDISLKCLALNTTTKEEIPNVSTGWSFINDYGEVLPIGKIAANVKLSQDDELQLKNLYENPNSRGRCMITIDQKVTLSSLYFKFHVPGETVTPHIPISPSYSDKRVRVEISGLNKQNQISVTRVGDDATLRCQAIVVDSSSPLYPANGVRYGWEWRYTDEDPVPTSNIAVNLEANGERLGLRGIRPPPGTKGRNIKGRCIVHVPAQQVDASLSPDDMLVYGSDYFTIDVARKPTTIDPQLIPIPGKESDNIEIVVDGLDSEGYLVANEKDSASVFCEARNRTTKQRLSTEGLRAEYDVMYGWEFADATGRSIDSSLFADSVSIDSTGSLRLRDLVAPNRGNLPYKIRCVAVVSKRPSTPEEKPGPSKSYKSDYFGLDIKRLDGTSTRLSGGEVDIAGNLVKVKIEGLKPDGTFTTQLGGNATIKCLAIDSKTNEPIEDVAVGWDIRRSNGAIVNMGILADQVTQEMNQINFYSMKPLNSFTDDIQGRCLVYRGNQIYRSDYFKVKVSTTPKETEIEGDGRIVVRLANIPLTDRRIILEPGEIESIQCVGTDAQTGEELTYLTYGWDYYYTMPDSSLPIQSSLGPMVKSVEESPSGYLYITPSSELNDKGEAYLRCRLSNGTSVYSSPYYRLVSEADAEAGEVIPVTPASRYLITVHGLNDDGNLLIKPEDKVSLECSAIDTTTRQPAENVLYLWEFQAPNGHPPKGDFQFSENQVSIDNLDTTSGTIKGRCKVSFKGSNKWDSSPDFIIQMERHPDEAEIIPPITDKDDQEKRKEYEEAIRQKGVKEADDDRVVVTVEGLNDAGHLIEAGGAEKTLDCNAEVQEGLNAEILAYSWELLDAYGNPVSLSILADNVIITSNDGVLKLNGLRVSELSQRGDLKGRCTVKVNITKSIEMPDGTQKDKTEQLIYRSNMFGVAITESGDYTGTIGGQDIKGTSVYVKVIGLSPQHSLVAESGDKINLQCFALDEISKEPITDAVYAWEIRDRNGHLVMTESVAKTVLRSDNVISFIHLRPTSDLTWSRNIFGRCSAFIPKTKHIYYSHYFHIDVRQPLISGKTGPDDEIQVEVKGIPPNGVLEGEEGDKVNLECRAVNTSDNQPISSKEAIYHFQFDEAAPDRDDTYGGYLADEVIQEKLPEDDGINLSLNGLKANKWHRGRCVITLLPKDDMNKTAKEPTKRYTSKYFWSDIRHKGEVKIEGFDPKKQIVTISGITYDPNVLVKVHGTNPNDTITLKPGSNVELNCFALETTTGEPIKGMNYAWEFRTYDNQPIHTNRLADQILSGTDVSENGQKIHIEGYRSTGEGIRIRCLAKGTDKVVNTIRKGQVYASPIYTFETIKGVDEVKTDFEGERRRYEPSDLHPEVIGLNADGTLTAKEGEDVKLQCQVIDSSTGVPIEDEKFNVGWTIASGPDGQPIQLKDLAETVTFNHGEMTLKGLNPTKPKSGGLRGYCTLYLDEQNLLTPSKYENQTVVLNSNVFVIHVDAKQPESQIQPDKAEEQTPFTQWIPGKDPKDAVIVKVSELRPDGTVSVPPGDNLKLNCIALDAVSLRRLTPTDRQPPLFTWELRSTMGGQLLPYTEQSNGPIIIKQPTRDPQTAEEAGVSIMKLQTIRLPPDAPSGAWGRCVVNLGHQVFTSPYFHIQLQKETTMETYSSLPKSHWSDDKNIELIVKGLDPDGNKIVQEGSDIELTCEARNTKTQEVLKDDKILLGWQFLDPEKHAYLTPWVSNGQFSGNSLQLKEIELPGEQDNRWDVWGYCVGDIRDGDRVKHYQSDPFNLVVTAGEPVSEPKEIPSAVKEGIFVKVKGITDDKLFVATEGSDSELTCHAIDFNTGQEYVGSKVTYGWDWRQMDGEPADISELVDVLETDDNKIKLSNIKSTSPKKGRCLVTVWPEDGATDQQPKQYASEFFFTNIQPLDATEKLKPEDIIPFDAVGDKVIFEITPMDDKKQISLTTDKKIDEVTVVAKLASTNTPLDDTTNPQLLRYSYDLAYINGLPAHTGELGESVVFNTKDGKLSITNPHHTTKPLKIRFNAIVKETEEGDDDVPVSDKLPQLKRYRSDYYPINIQPVDGSEKPSWSIQPVPVYDISGRSNKVEIEGLDENGNAAGIPGDDMTLTCVVLDDLDLEVDLKSTSYTWQFIDAQGNPVNPSRIGEQVEIKDGKYLNIKGYRKTTEQDYIRGRCVIMVTVPLPIDAEVREDLPPIQEYGSSYFRFTKKVISDQGEKPETSVTEEIERFEETTTPISEVTEGAQDLNFYLKIGSSTNDIYPMEKSKQTLLARVQRPLELSCEAVFSETPSESGNQLPKLVWYYRQPEIPGDVPIPSQLLPISPPRMETLSILPQDDHKISLSSDAYTFRDDNAEFQCQAFMEDEKPVATEVIFIQKVREIFDVRIFDEESRSRLYAFTGTSKTLTCFVDDLTTGERVEPSGYQWEMNLGDGTGIWIRETDPRQGAVDISGWRSNQLYLNDLRLPSTSTSDEAVYEVRCVASYNNTYNTSSHPFIINVRNQPTIKSIRIDRVKPDEAVLEPVDLPKDSYDATQDYEIGCKPEVTSGEAVATWLKCSDDECTSTKEIVLTGDRLFFFANSTRYVDEGRFRCQVSLQLKEYNFKLVEHQDVIIKRQAVPAIFSSGTITYTTNDEMSLQCTDESSSPESRVEWMFEPAGKPPTERRLPKVIGNTYAYGRIYIFAIARGQLIPEHSGKYTCIATNPYGTANSSITVTVTEDLSRGKLRFVRRIIRRAIAT